MALKTSEVYRCLEKKTLVMGFEILDLFIVFSALATLNLLFGGLPYKFLWTWVPSLVLALVLRIGKAGKPDNYFLHLARFHTSPGVLSVFPQAKARQQFLKKVGNENGERITRRET